MENILSIMSRAREQRSKRLNLSNRKLVELPIEIGELTELQVLWLNDNQLGYLPPKIGKLKKLRRLNLSNNKLLELPDEIGELIDLQKLKLKNNRLSELPSCTTYLTQLELLSLSHNSLIELLDSLSSLTKLKELYLNNIELIDFPYLIGHLINLETLELSGNKIRELPKELSQLRKLKWLDLYNNELIELPLCCPNLFIIRGSSREGDLTGLFEPIRSQRMLEKVREKVWKQRMELQLYCQVPGYWHPLGYERGKDDPQTGLYQIEVSSNFLRKVAPLLSNAVKIMKFAPIVPPCISWTDLEKYEKQIKEDVTRVKSLVDGLSKTIEHSPEEKMIDGLGDNSMYSQVSISAMSELRALLLMKDKDQIWGKLKRFMTKEGHWLWLCPEHYEMYRSEKL